MNPTIASTRHKTRRACAFTLVELLIALMILAVALGIAVPSLQPNARARLVSAASLVAADLEYAQSLSIATPGDLALVKFDPDDPDGATYWIALESDPDTPINKPYSEDLHIITFGEDAASELDDVDITLVGVTDQVVFDAVGRLKPATDVRVQLTNGGGTFEVVISAATGFITIESGAGS